jgi:hypothetical protein
MEEQEWLTLRSYMNADISGFLQEQYAQSVLDEVNEELAERAKNPIEQDFITEDAWGKDPAERRVVSIDGIEVQIRSLHQRGLGLTDVKGADLLYEIEGVKFALIQYKRPDLRGRVKRETRQLKELIGACPNPCPPYDPHLRKNCGSWFAVRSTAESAYLPACQAKKLFRGENYPKKERFTSVDGYSHDGFRTAFAKCQIGAHIPTVGFKIPQFIIEQAWINQNRILLYALQLGSFRRRR